MLYNPELDTEIKKFAEVVRRNIRYGHIPDMEDIERGMRDAALRDGSAALSHLLSEIPDIFKDSIVCPACNSKMESIGRRKKSIVTLLGEGILNRAYYECTDPSCKQHRFLKDELLDIVHTSFSPGLRRLMSKIGSSDPFYQDSINLKEFSGIEVQAKDIERVAESLGSKFEEMNQNEIGKYYSIYPEPMKKKIPVMYLEFDGTGVPVTPKELIGRRGKQEDGTAKTREAKIGCVFTQTTRDTEGKPVRDKGSTTYVGAIEPVESFSKRLEAEAVRRGYWQAERIVILGDGAKWVWRLADEHFHDAIQIVDYYHASEHLHDLLQKIFPGNDQLKAETPGWIDLLEQGNIEEIINKVHNTYFPGAMPEPISKGLAYFQQNIEKMRYADFKKLGFFIGSGVIEAACKTIIGKRLKQSGMRWSVKGANSIIALRCSMNSGRFDEQWEGRDAS